MAYNSTQHNIVKLPAWRRRVLLIAVLSGFVGLFARGIYLQSLHKDFLQQKGDARYSRSLVLQANRGKITDRNGELLAISSPVESVWASPPDVDISKTQKNARVNIHFKQRDTVKGVFIRTNDYDELKSKNFWRIVTSSNIEMWKKTKDMNLARIFNGMEFTRLSEES